MIMTYWMGNTVVMILAISSYFISYAAKKHIGSTL